MKRFDLYGNSITASFPVIEKFLNAGNNNAAADYSVTPANFDAAPVGVVNYIVSGFTIVAAFETAGDIDFSKFADLAGALATGLVFSYQSNGLASSLVTMYTNADLMTLCGSWSSIKNTTQINVIKSEILFAEPIFLTGAQSDYIRMTVADDFSSLQALQATAHLAQGANL